MNRRPGVWISALALGGAVLSAGRAPAQTQPQTQTQTQTLAGAPDRYGAEPRSIAYDRPAASGQAAPAAPMRLRTRFLTWPGKVQPTAPSAPTELAPTYAAERATPPRRVRAPLWNPAPVVAPRRAPRASAYDPRPASDADRRALPTSIYSPRTYSPGIDRHGRTAGAVVADQPPGWATDRAARGWAPYSPALARAADREPVQAYAPRAARSWGPPASPTYPAPADLSGAPQPNLSRPSAGQSGAAQPVAAQPIVSRSVNPNGVRFYSVHRAFGLTPDPAPIPPQFFAATPDLGDPPGPTATRRTVAGAGLSTVAARNAAEAADSDAAASQP